MKYYAFFGGNGSGRTYARKLVTEALQNRLDLDIAKAAYKVTCDPVLNKYAEEYNLMIRLVGTRVKRRGSLKNEKS